jgi:uncharacterized MnhB-related membrane protein
VTAIQVVALALVALGGTAVVFTPEPLRQTIVLGVYGVTLTALFFSFQAPDVALSELTVSSLGLPLIVLAALRKLREQEKQAAAAEEDDEGGDS